MPLNNLLTFKYGIVKRLQLKQLKIT